MAQIFGKFGKLLFLALSIAVPNVWAPALQAQSDQCLRDV
jgi:hypothetical protein